MVHHHEGRLLLASILGFGGGIYTFLKGFRTYRKYRLVADTPAIRIRSVPMGLVQIRGEARTEETLLSPLTHTPCCVFMVFIEQWHTDSQRGGEWKAVATDVKGVKFYLQDDSGKVLIDPANCELDLPLRCTREVHNTGVGSGPASPLPAGAGASATDGEVLEYIEQARVRHFGQMVGRGVAMVGHAASPEGESRRKSFLDMLADPGGPGAEAFQLQLMKAAMARRDPSGQLSRLAIEVWKHPQGTPEFDAALLQLGQAYNSTLAGNQHIPDRAALLAQARQNPQALAMAAMAAASAEPQADPENERARQAAMAFGRAQMAALSERQSHAASGRFRLREYCLLPGQTYDVTGSCTENPKPRDEYDRNIIVKGTNEPTFLISSRTEKAVQSWLFRQSLYMVLGGAALAVLCLAIFLGKIGLLR